MGRKKIVIEKIENAKNRAITFRKRRYGFFKKATELAKLCDVDISIIITNKRQSGVASGVIDQENAITTFSSTDLKQHLKNFAEHRGETIHFDADMPNMTTSLTASESISESPERFTADGMPQASIPLPNLSQAAMETPAALPARPVFEVLRPIPTKPKNGVTQPFMR